MEDTSALFELLAAERRRQVLFLLCGADSVQVPEGLHTRGGIRARQSQSRGSPSPSPPLQNAPSADQSLDRLDMELSHVHLPKLEDSGLVEWDSEAGTVFRGPAFEEAEPVLRLLAANADRLPGDLF